MSRRSARPSPGVSKVVETPAVAAPAWLRVAIVALTALLIMAWSSTDVSDPDTWWHLKTGEYIVQHHTLPVPDPFSYTTYMGKAAYQGEEATRYFNLTHEWLAQIGMYLVYAAGGFTAMVLVRSLLIALFCGVMGMAVHHRTQSFALSVAAALGAASVACQFRADRPYLLTYLFLGITVALVDRRHWMWALPPLFLIWANCHGGFFVGWLALFAFCAESVLRRKFDRQLWIVTAACLLASELNPNWFKVIPVMISYRNSIMQSTLWEWQYTNPWPPSPYSTLLVLALAVMVWRWRETRPVDWLLLVGYGILASMAVRNIILAALVGPLMIATYVPWRKAPRAWVEFAAAALLLAGTAGAIAMGRAFQFRAANWRYSAGAADFILAHHITGPMFNTYEYGGYLIWRLWPQERVFIDGRALNEQVYLDYQRIAFNAEAANGKSGEELLKEYGIEVILMDGFEFTSGAPYLLPAALSDPKQTEWKLVYQDAQAVIYMRHPPADIPVLNSFDALAAMETQCTTYIANDPGHPRCALGLEQLFAKIGDGVRARRWAAIYREHPE